MRVTDALRGEHGVLYAMFDRIETGIAEGVSPEELQVMARMLEGALVPHAELENTLLFAALEPRIGPMGPLAVMRGEHEEIEGGIRRALVEDPADRARTLSAVIGSARAHFAKEERVLFPIAEQQLDEPTLADLAVRWAAARRVTLA